MAIWGQNATSWPFCDVWTVPSCTVKTFPEFRNNDLTLSFTAYTVRPYFDGPYRHTVLAQPWLILSVKNASLSFFSRAQALRPCSLVQLSWQLVVFLSCLCEIQLGTSALPGDL